MGVHMKQWFCLIFAKREGIFYFWKIAPIQAVVWLSESLGRFSLTKKVYFVLLYTYIETHDLQYIIITSYIGLHCYPYNLTIMKPHAASCMFSYADLFHKSCMALNYTWLT